MDEPTFPRATSRRAVLFGGLLGAAGLAAPLGQNALALSAPDVPLLPSLIPDRIGGWRNTGSRGLILPAEVPQQAFYDRELQRIYESATARPMMLVMAYCARPQQGLIRIHDPRVCYPGAGFTLTQTQKVRLALGKSVQLEAHSFVAARPDRTEQVIYWTRVGDGITGPAEDQHVAILRSLVAGSVPDGLLVRVSALGEGPGVKAEIRGFVHELISTVTVAGKEFLLGPTLASTWSRGVAAQA